MEPLKIKIKKTHDQARLPLITKGNACFDFYALEDTEIRSMHKGPATLVRTGLAFEIPEGYHMKLFMRSSYGAKKKIFLANCVGIIDSSYRGEVRGIFKATTGRDSTKWIRAGERFMQGLIEKNIPVEFEEANELSQTKRGESGFGSTGE